MKQADPSPRLSDTARAEGYAGHCRAVMGSGEETCRMQAGEGDAAFCGDRLDRREHDQFVGEARLQR